jgi:sugar lactone lactonase YvrE
VTAELAFDVDATLGEGALWDWRQGRLVSVDITGGLVHVSDPDDGSTRSIDVGQAVGAAMLCGERELLLAVRDGFTWLDLETEALGQLVPVEADRPANRMNDGACDPHGRCFAGTMAFDSTPRAGTLYRLDPDLSVQPLVPGVGVSNGIGWSLAGDVMYYVDSLAHGVEVYDYDGATGAISDGRRLVDTDPAWGLPDGLAMDAEGGLWVAFWDGSALRRFDPDGELTATVEVPAARPTRPAFGGPELDRLYLTTAKLDPHQPVDGDPGGAIFVLDAGVRGLPANLFARGA